MDIEIEEIKHSLRKWWHENGQLWIEGCYDVNGKVNGPWKDWCDNGELMWAVYYVNGIQEGEEIHYGY